MEKTCETLRFNSRTHVDIWCDPQHGEGPNYIETVMDGMTVPALYTGARDSAKVVEDLGYDNPFLMSVEHELGHTILSIIAGLPFSPTLYNVARGLPEKLPWWIEEGMVLEFQRVNKGKVIQIARHVASYPDWSK